MQTIAFKGGAIPAIGYGTYPLSGAEARRGVAMALELGCRHLDTAQLYGNEREVGLGLADSGLPRDQVFVTTKVHPSHYAPAQFAGTVAESLDKLGLDQVDLLLLHWPNQAFPMRQTLELLLAAQDAGRARFVGVSNLTARDLERAVEMTGGRIVNHQIELHPLIDRSDVQAAAARHGVSVTAYCPVARGAVTREPTLVEIGRAHGKSAAQVALRWMVQQNVVPIPMSRSREHVAANLDIFDFALDEAEMRRIDALRGRNLRVVHFAGLAPDWD